VLRAAVEQRQHQLRTTRAAAAGTMLQQEGAAAITAVVLGA
jgi:hypothetical protein